MGLNPMSPSHYLCPRKYVNIWCSTRQLATDHERDEYRTVGRKCGYSFGDLMRLKKIIQKDGTLYLDELQHKLSTKCRKHFHVSTIVRMISKLAFTRKRLYKLGFHFNYENVKAYKLTLGMMNVRKNQLVFADESYHHDRIANRKYGRSLRYMCVWMI